jgi:hypothetical protein
MAIDDGEIKAERKALPEHIEKLVAGLEVPLPGPLAPRWALMPIRRIPPT